MARITEEVNVRVKFDPERMAALTEAAEKCQKTYEEFELALQELRNFLMTLGNHFVAEEVKDD